MAAQNRLSRRTRSGWAATPRQGASTTSGTQRGRVQMTSATFSVLCTPIPPFPCQSKIYANSLPMVRNWLTAPSSLQYRVLQTSYVLAPKGIAPSRRGVRAPDAKGDWGEHHATQPEVSVGPPQPCCDIQVCLS